MAVHRPSFSRGVLFGREEIWWYPYFGPRVPFMIDRVLDKLPDAVWDQRLTTTDDLAAPSIWERASEASRSVAVVDPFPIPSALMALRGAMAVNAGGNTWRIATTSDVGGSVIETRELPDEATVWPQPDVLSMHSQRTRVALDLSRVSGRPGRLLHAARRRLAPCDWRAAAARSRRFVGHRHAR